MILRYYVPSAGRDAHLAECIETCQRTGIREILLFTSPAYGPGSGFLDRDELTERLNHLNLCAERIRAAGLVFSLNVFATLGHVYVPEAEVTRFGFWRQIGPSGAPALHPVLDPACPALHTYLVAAYAAYASLHPRVIFVDDDFGVGLNNVYHPARLAKFAARVGVEPDRSLIAGLLFSEDPAVSLQARWLMRELVTADLVDLAQEVQLTVHQRNPDIRMGLMFPSSAFFDVAAVAQALAGSHQPLVRPQLPLYREERPVSAYGDSLWQLNFWRAHLPETFEIWPEAENYPYTDYQKSPEAGWVHAAYCFGCGVPQVALSLNSFSRGIPAGESRRMVEKFSTHRKQLVEIEKLLQGGSEELGVAIWEPGEVRQLGLNQAAPIDALRLLGIPIESVRDYQEGTLYWGNSLNILARPDLEWILARGALLDLDSADSLQAGGYLEKIGLKLGPACAADEALNLRFTRQDGSPEDWPIYYFIRGLGVEGMPRAVEAADARVLVGYIDDQDRDSLPFALAWTGPQGARFAFINASFRLWPHNAFLNPWMGGVLAQLCQWVDGRTLPARVVAGPNVALQVLRFGDGDNILCTLINYSTTSQPEIRVALNEDLARLKFSEILADGSCVGLAVDKVAGTASLHLTGPMECLGVRFVLGTGGPYLPDGRI